MGFRFAHRVHLTNWSYGVCESHTDCFSQNGVSDSHEYAQNISNIYIYITFFSFFYSICSKHVSSMTGTFVSYIHPNCGRNYRNHDQYVYNMSIKSLIHAWVRNIPAMSNTWRKHIQNMSNTCRICCCALVEKLQAASYSFRCL